MKRLTLVLLLYCLVFPASACYNFYFSVDREGHLHHSSELLEPFNKNFSLERNVRRLKKLEKKLENTFSFQLLSDYAVVLTRLGKTREALTILEALNTKYPNEYKILANLGTTYELSGQPEKALDCIQRSLKINPDAHEGSEWVHVKILEAKLAMQNDPDYLNRHTVLGLTDAQKQDTNIRNQIVIQLKERIPYTPRNSPVMANLLVDLGDCYANTQSVEYAKALYTMSKKHYGNTSPGVDAKIKEMLRLRNRHQDVKPEKRRGEGDNIKMTGLSYTALLRDNQSRDYQIDWDGLNLDVILGLLGSKQIEASQEIQIDTKKPLKPKKLTKEVAEVPEENLTEEEAEVPEVKTEKKKGKKKIYLDFGFWVVVFVLAAIFVLWVIQRLKRDPREPPDLPTSW